MQIYLQYFIAMIDNSFKKEWTKFDRKMNKSWEARCNQFDYKIFHLTLTMSKQGLGSSKSSLLWWHLLEMVAKCRERLSFRINAITLYICMLQSDVSVYYLIYQVFERWILNLPWIYQLLDSASCLHIKSFCHSSCSWYQNSVLLLILNWIKIH